MTCFAKEQYLGSRTSVDGVAFDVTEEPAAEEEAVFPPLAAASSSCVSRRVSDEGLRMQRDRGWSTDIDDTLPPPPPPEAFWD